MLRKNNVKKVLKFNTARKAFIKLPMVRFKRLKGFKRLLKMRDWF